VYGRARARLDAAPEFEVARHRAQLDVRQPLPDLRAPAEILDKRARRRRERAVLPVGPQAQVDAVEVAVAREA
jgi:hypothetical protein